MKQCPFQAWSSALRRASHCPPPRPPLADALPSTREQPLFASPSLRAAPSICFSFISTARCENDSLGGLCQQQPEPWNARTIPFRSGDSVAPVSESVAYRLTVLYRSLAPRQFRR